MRAPGDLGSGMLTAAGAWSAIGATVHILGCLAAVFSAAWLTGRRARFGPAGGAIVFALGLTTLWCVAVVIFGSAAPYAHLAEAARNLAWVLVIFRLFASDGRHASLAPIRPVVLVLSIVETVQFGLALMAAPSGAPLPAVFFNLTALLQLLVAVGALVLVHNLYLGASAQSRLTLRWPALALAILWGVDLNFYAIAYLAADWPAELAALRGFCAVALGVLLAAGAAQNREELRFRPSRSMAFQTVSLLLIGAYLLAMLAVARWIAYAGGDFAELMELGFVTLAVALAVLVLASVRLRAWLRVTISKHLFQHRYDYRAEWLRFNRTMGEADPTQTVEERVIKAVADISESPAGLLLLPDESGDLRLAARWQWREADVPALAMAADSAAFFERGTDGRGFIVDLDDLRAGWSLHGEGAAVPRWLQDETRAWALVPLLHFERLRGVVVLASPLWPRKLDWEDFDLLRVVGQQLASYLAEHAGQRALEEANRFDDFNRRIAFVMHDIKNLASQLGLLARNAEIHADKPAFRDDMLVTLRNSADKLNALLARLSRYGGSSVQQVSAVDGATVLRAVTDRFHGSHPVAISDARSGAVLANPETLEQVLVHLVQNAVDASSAGAPVFLSLTSDGIQAKIDVVDSGTGMSPDFVRSKLFKPFVSSKPGGFGIGAFEARELVRAMRGRLEVESREGLGTRFTISLPLAGARGLFDHTTIYDQDVA